MSRVNYYEYLRSPEWQVVRRLALERAAGRCQVCNQPGRLDVHHRTYARLGKELLSDVTVLCRDCHSKHHDKLAAAPDPVPPTWEDRIADAAFAALGPEGVRSLVEVGTPVFLDEHGDVVGESSNGLPLASSNHTQATRIAEEVFGVQTQGEDRQGYLAVFDNVAGRCDLCGRKCIWSNPTHQLVRHPTCHARHQEAA